MAATEQSLELLFKIDDDLVETLLESQTYGFVHIRDDAIQIIHCFLNICLLRRQELISFPDGLIFFDSTNVYFAQLFDPVLDLSVFFHSR